MGHLVDIATERPLRAQKRPLRMSVISIFAQSKAACETETHPDVNVDARIISCCDPANSLISDGLRALRALAGCP